MLSFADKIFPVLIGSCFLDSESLPRTTGASHPRTLSTAQYISILYYMLSFRYQRLSATLVPLRSFQIWTTVSRIFYILQGSK